MRIRINHRQPTGEVETEIWYDVERAWLDPCNDSYKGQWLTMCFYEGSPNYKKFKYGETSIEIDPDEDDITFKND